jgi:cysteate synthase
MGRYELRCAAGGESLVRNAMGCPVHNALAKPRYAAQLLVRDLPGIWRFIDWLPVSDSIPGVDPSPVCYRSGAFAAELGLTDLWISFNGYWPERGGHCPTCTFKDLEAAPTMQRLLEMGGEAALVVASAGNTGKAFAHVASLTGRPLVLLVPVSCFEKLWLPRDDPDRGGLFVIGVKGDYADAIELADRLSKMPGFVAEGGARNVARRDGLGTVMLDAATSMGRLPDHYIQAVGSGAGGIAAWEAAQRLIADGRFGNVMPKLHLAQNLPCAPILSLFSGQRVDERCPEGMYDEVLFNRRPAFDVGGGVRDALRATRGTVVGITNEQAFEARLRFQSAEGIDIAPAAAVAAAALVKQVEDGQVKAEDRVLLNITGGGEALRRKETGTRRLPCNLRIDEGMADLGPVASYAMEYLGRRAEAERGKGR